MEIARREDLAELECLLNDWLKNREDTLVKYTTVIEIDASADDPSYTQVLPTLLARIQPLLAENQNPLAGQS